MKTKSALSYFGSDASVADRLGSKLDHCKHVTIPFVGGASILPYLKARAIVANDLNDAAINFYKVASGVRGNDEFEKLVTMAKNTLSHPGELERALVYVGWDQASPSQRAWSYWAQCWIGRKGKGGTKHLGGMPSVRRTANGGTNASRVRAAAADLEEWAHHFGRCEWEAVCFRELLPKVADQSDCGVYCDAPWVGAGRNYLHSFTEQDHVDLAKLLRTFKKTAVVIRYGNDPLIRDLYSTATWQWEEVETRGQANNQVKEVWISRRATE